MSNYLKANPEATKYVLKSYDQDMKDIDETISPLLRLPSRPVKAIKKMLNLIFKHTS